MHRMVESSGNTPTLVCAHFHLPLQNYNLHHKLKALSEESIGCTNSIIIPHIKNNTVCKH